MKKAILFLSLPALILIANVNVHGQTTRPADPGRATMHREVPDQPYMAPDPDHGTSLARRFKSLGFFTAQVNVDADGNNILGDAANEPSIAIDPTDPDHLVIGWRQFDNVFSNFRQAGWGYTTDGGQRWTFPGNIEAGVFRSDPVLDFDTAGKFYYNSLTSNSGNFSCKVFRSDNGGATWDAGVEARGGDKQWMTIDKTGGEGTGNIYSFWTTFYSSCAPYHFTRSTDGGDSYEPCVAVIGTPYWGTMAVGPDGELYITGAGSAGGVMIAKSTTAKIPGGNIGWDFQTQIDLDGYLTAQSMVNPSGLLGQSNVAVDCSNGPGRGNVYVLASLARNNGDPGDVMFSKSTDGGVTFSLPQRINNDPSDYNTQWFGTMSVAPNGRIDVVWLDTRDDPATAFLSALYYCYSDDQGVTWSINKRLSESFDPSLGYPQQNKMGDYFDMKSDDAGAHLAWASTLNGEQDVYYSHIIPQIVAVEDLASEPAKPFLSVYPNPFHDKASISFSIDKKGPVLLEVLNLYGQCVAFLAEDHYQAGSHAITFDGASLPAGYYQCRIMAGDQQTVVKMVKGR